MSAAIVLGAGGCAIADLAEARAIAPGAMLLAVNVALTQCARADAFATLHPEKAHAWEPRAQPMPADTFAPAGAQHWRPRHVVRERWAGTSGLYGVQIALEWFGVDRVILAGIPMTADAGSLYGPGNWSENGVSTYRRSWAQALPALVGRVTSVSGWTSDLLGHPSTEWVKGARQLA